MEETQPKTKKRRSRFKSNIMEKVADDTTSTTSLNGEKAIETDNVKDINPESVDASDDTKVRSENEEGSDDKSLASEPSDDLKSEKGRKRKLSEMKSNDGSSDEAVSKDNVVNKDDEPSVENVTESVEKATESAENTTESVENAIESENATESMENTTESVENAAEPIENTIEPVVIKTEITSEVKPEVTFDSTSGLAARQLLGKGKRARIPNKRYSDLPLKSIRSSLDPTDADPGKLSKLTRSSLDPMDVDSGKPSHENGEFKETAQESETYTEATTKEAPESSSPRFGSPIPAAVTAIKTPRSSQSNSPSTPTAKKLKLTVDLTNPNYLKPFKYGWKRELVYRATGDNTTKRNGDIYYYTPTGKKVRSMREVSENLKNRELTLEDFTFFKEPLGLDDPDKEIIRDAKLKTATPASATKRTTPKVTVKPAKAASSPKPVTSTIEEPKPKNSTRLGGFKIKLPSRANPSIKAKDKNKKEDLNLEVGTYPPNWPSPPVKKTTKSSSKTPSKKSKRLSSAMAAMTALEAEKKEGLPMGSYLQNVVFGYNTLLYVFQYLKVQDLLRAGCVCTMWNDITNHSSLWRVVRMKNSQIHSFKGMFDALEKHGTLHLDLRKMLLPSSNNDDIWQEFSAEVKKASCLRKIELCRCPAVVIEQLASSNPKLEVINAVTIKCESMNLAQLTFLNNLQELRLKSTAGFSLTSDLTALAELKQLKHLSLTSIRELNKLNIEVIADLENLESLDLGECAEFPKTFGSQILSKLEKLEKLRLEKGQGNCYTFEILEAVKNMPHLEQLELVNFDIKTGFDRCLGACTNIKKLLIIPTYISQSATTNHMVLGGVLRLQTTLSHFVWGVTLELLRVTELFVDQCEDPEKKAKREKRAIANGDSIPVLKPVPLLREGVNTEIPPAQDPPQVEILPLPNLQKLLLQSLPTTRVKILKIPFHATWRQSITDTVN